MRPDTARVVGQSHVPGDDPGSEGPSRLSLLAQRVLGMTDDDVRDELGDVRRRFSARHRDLEGMLSRNAGPLAQLLAGASSDRRLLAGAYLSHEYAFEAAVTNPSIVPAPDQSGLPEGATRFVMSLRAIGEGHVSSIEFRTGTAHADGSVDLDAPSPHAETGERRAAVYERRSFGVKLGELGADRALAARVLDQLPRLFGPDELEEAVGVLDDTPRAVSHETVKLINWLTASNYLLDFSPATSLSERLLWPEGPFESHGMEDARFVLFTEDDGTTTYYATYTAFDGFEILPQLIETNDFRSFEITTVNGRSAQNKGMALFPRLIDDRYVALSRPDRENIHLVTSDDPRSWRAPSVPLRRPERPWEFAQMGNCGSPMETTEGWLVITHGVGPMRTYRLGAMLLDLEHPERVIADITDPILEATEEQRNGYVPNVVYSCGGMIHGDHLILPYGVADLSTEIARFSLAELLGAMTGPGCATAR